MMKNFNYYQPTEIRFGWGRFMEIPEVVTKYGKRCLLVTESASSPLSDVYDQAKASLCYAGIEVAHFAGVIANPTTDCITAGAEMALSHQADVVVGLGGGSSMDAAKAIAVEATHEGTCWDYLFFREAAPSEKTLPVVAITTTSGTGSQVTQVAVVTNTEERCKSALYHPLIFPQVAIVDPELMLTVPDQVTAATGFDAFTHAFESYIHVNASPYTNLLSEQAIKLIVKNLPMAIADGSDCDARINMAWADTLAGLCIANAGVTLPHGMGMAMGGMFPHIAHGEALALTYPEFIRYTYVSALPRFAFLARAFNPELCGVSDEEAAKEASVELEAFLSRIGLRLSLSKLNVPHEELPELARASMVLPDYRNNPRVATEDDILAMLNNCYK
jgi:alcohol dehydrogenase class IV